MIIWIEVLDASGNRYGSGPVTTATGWRSTAGLDTVGGFSFAMPAADPMAQHVKNRRYVHCWGASEDVAGWPVGIQDLGMGIIEDVSLRVRPGEPSMLDVSGSDLLQELANVIVGDLDLFWDEVRAPESVIARNEFGAMQIWEPGARIDLTNQPLGKMYFRSPDPFHRITFDLGPPPYVNTAIVVLNVEYYCEGEKVGWQPLTFNDTTRRVVNTAPKTHVPWDHSGYIEFEPPVDWGAATLGAYEIAVFCNTGNLTEVQFNNITITVRQPTRTALQDVMALAPAGWSLDPTGKVETEEDVLPADRKGIYLQASRQSVFAVLGVLAQQFGEHFILSPSGRRVKWLGKDAIDSGLRALGPADPGSEPDPFTLYIHSQLSRSLNSFPLFTRIYAQGGGVGRTRITLSDATDTAPAGYTLNGAEGWLQRDAAVVEFGRIDTPVDYPDIVAMSIAANAQHQAGNTLLQRAYEDLRLNSMLQESYALAVIPARYRLWPGQTIRISYHEWTDDGYHAVSIEDTLWVLEVATEVTTAGVFTTGLTVSKIDAYWMSNARRSADEIIMARAARNVELPEDALSNYADGEVTQLYVSNGRVTQLVKTAPVTPYADGRYPPAGQAIDEIEIQNGKIVDISFVNV